VTGLRSIAYGRGQTIPASRLGKFKMISQVVAILLLILGRDHLGGLFALGRVALWVVLVAAVASAVDYYRRFTWSAGPRASSELLGDRRSHGPGG